MEKNNGKKSRRHKVLSCIMNTVKNT